MTEAMFCPIVHTFSTSDLTKTLARSNLGSITELLAAFETGIERVNVRNSSFELQQLDRFNIKFVERALPREFLDEVEAGADMSNHHLQQQRRRSATLSASGVPSNGMFSPELARTVPNSGLPELSGPTAINTPGTPFVPPTASQRDELFLDSLSSQISRRVEGWLAEPGREELLVQEPTKRVRGSEEFVPGVEKDELGQSWREESIDQLTPWYAAMRDEVMQRREMVEYDTFGWPVACLLAISSSHPDPLGALSALWDLTSREKLFSPASYPAGSGIAEQGRQEWANPDILRYVVLVHDFGAGGGRDGWEDAEKLFEIVGKTYGQHTALLPIFSAATTAERPEPRAQGISALWPTLPPMQPMVGLGFSLPASGPPQSIDTVAVEKGYELSENDVKAIKIFMREMVVQSIVPWMERSIVVGNEQYNASKRSIGGRLFSAGRKYFGGSATTSRAGSPATPLGYNVVRGFYPFAAQESQTRRLADLAFMIGDYRLAAAIYEQASKDYKADSAWKYYASACRMTGLAQLYLHPPATPLAFNPDIWLEQALQTPATGRADVVDFDGLKMMMLYYQAYQAIGDYRPAPRGLVRSAGEAEEMISAILLEQAALCDLRLPRSSMRKYAFHMAMAAARYEKCGLKSLSRRCLSQASHIYQWGVEAATPKLLCLEAPSPAWTAIRSHVHYGLGRKAYSMGQPEAALEHFLALLVGDGLPLEEDGAADQSWVDDFSLAWEQLGSRAVQVVAERRLHLNATLFHSASIISNKSEERAKVDLRAELWYDLEKEYEGRGVSKRRPLTRRPVNEVVVGDTFHIGLRAVNPLNARVALGGLAIETDQTGSVEISIPDDIVLEARESKLIQVPVRITSLGSCNFTRITYRFNNLLPCSESLEGIPKRLISTRDQLTTPTYSQSPLCVTIRSPIPVLQVNLDDLPAQILEGQTISTLITLRNTGGVTLRDLQVLCNLPSFVRFSAGQQSMIYTPTAVQSSAFSVSNRVSSNAPLPIELGLDRTGARIEGIEPGHSVKVKLICRGDAVGTHDIRWLFAFSGIDGEILSTRVCRKLVVTPSLRISTHVRSNPRNSSAFSLGLTISNSSIHSPIVITSVSSLSSRWQLKLPSLALEESALAPRQSTRLFLSIDPVAGEPPVDEADLFVVNKLEALLQGKEVTGAYPKDFAVATVSTAISEAGTLDLSNHILLASVTASMNAARIAALSTQFPTLSASLFPHLFPLFSTSSLTLIVAYTSATLGPAAAVMGHLLVTLPLGARSNILSGVLERAAGKSGGIYEESQRERKLLVEALKQSEWGVDDVPVHASIYVGNNSSMEHSFDKGSCCVPVTVSLCNTSPRLAVKYRLNFAPAAGASLYAGPTLYTGEVNPMSTVNHSLQVWVTAPGSYQVGPYTLDLCASEGQTWSHEGQGTWTKVRQSVST